MAWRLRLRAPLLLLILGAAIGAYSITFTTIAGSSGGAGIEDGTGAAARFSNPNGVAVDAAGNVYVADMWNDTIRKISPAGEVTTLAGLAGSWGSKDGTRNHARFFQPTSLCLDAAGNIYVTDRANATIRKITPDGVVTTLAGSPGVYAFVNGTGSAARFVEPHGIAIDGAGNLYVTDIGNNNHRIRKITPDGVVTTFAGAGTNGSDNGTGTAAKFFYPHGITYDATTSALYVADSTNDVIRKITVPGAEVTTYAGVVDTPGTARGPIANVRFNNPYAITSRNGTLYVSDFSNTITELTSTTGTTIGGLAGYPGPDDGALGTSRFGSAGGLAVDGSGDIYVADGGNEAIRKIVGTTTSTFAGAAERSGFVNGTGTDARFKDVEQIAYYPGPPGGWAFVADSGNNAIRKVVISTGEVTTYAGGTYGYVNANGTNAAFRNPRGVVYDGYDAALYVADTGNNVIRKVAFNGDVTLYAGNPTTSGSTNGDRLIDAKFYFPVALALDSVNNLLYVADMGNGVIRKIHRGTGVVSTLLHPTTGDPLTFDAAPQNVSVDSSGNVYVGVYGKIIKVTPSAVTTFAGKGCCLQFSVDGPGTLANFGFPGPGNTSWFGTSGFVAEPFTSVVRTIGSDAFVGTAGGLSNVSGASDGTGNVARFNFISSVAATSASSVLVAEQSRVRKGSAGLSDMATIDNFGQGPVGVARQLDVSPSSATSWQWSIVRRPAGSTATLSATNIRNPTFTPDVADLYIFRVVASTATDSSITQVSLQANGPATSLTVGYPGPYTAGLDVYVPVTAKDSAGNAAIQYTGTVHFTSSDPLATLPPDYTFVSADRGAHFFGPFVFRTAGPQTVTATDSANGLVGVWNLTVTPASAASLTITGSASAVAGEPTSYTVTLRDAFNNVATGYRGTVQFSSNDDLAELPSNYAFTAGDNGVRAFNVTFKRAGSRVLTVNQVGSGTLTHTVGVSVTHGTGRTYAITAPEPVQRSRRFTVTVTATDPFGNIVPSYTGTVIFNSESDPYATLPPNYTFTEADAGSHTFTNAFMFRTAGAHWFGVHHSGLAITKIHHLTVAIPPSVRGDVDGDADADIVWRYEGSGGAVYLWQMNGSTITAATPISAVADASWQMVASGDFDGDGRTDLFWRHATSGATYLWLMDGATILSATPVSVVDPAWRVVAAGDLDGDGADELFWRNSTTGQNYHWRLIGTTLAAATPVTAVDPSWNVVGIGDFDGDGREELFWRRDGTGENYIWRMNGAALVSSHAILGVSDGNWKVVGVGDFTGDGKSDVFWRHATSGDDYIWTMNGTAVTSATPIFAVTDPAWKVVGIGDTNNDARADVLWRRDGSGENYLWQMNGTTISSVTPLFALPDANWKLVAPK